MKAHKIFKNITRLLFALWGLILPMSLNAQTSQANIAWQKVELQSQFKSDLQKSLLTMVGSDKFVVTVDLKLKPIPKKTAIAPTATQKAPTPLTEENPDAILLSKLGILVDTQKHEAPPTSPEATKDANEIPDIFSLIEKVYVRCVLDSSVTDDRKALVQKVIETQLAGFEPNVVDIKIESMALTPPPPPEKAPEPEKPAPPPTFAEKMEPFKIPVSIFLSFITVMAMLIVVMKTLTKSQGAPSAQNAAPTTEASSPAAAESAKEAPQAAELSSTPATNPTVTHHDHHGSTGATFDSEELSLTVEKFKLLLKTNSGAAKLLMLEWVNSDTAAAAGALRTLPTYLTLEEFSLSTSDFDLNQRKRLKKVMSLSPAEAASPSEVLTFIKGQILSSMLADSVNIGPEQKSYLSSIKASELCTLAQKAPELVSGVINLLPSELVAQTFNLLDKDTVESLLQKSLHIEVENFLPQLEKLKEHVHSIREESKVNLAPVLEGVETLLEQVSPDKEAALFNALISSKAYSIAEQLSKKYFPSDLVLKLDGPKINSILMKMPLLQRAELIYSLGDNEKQVLFVAMGENGKLREMIDSEIESIETDESRKKMINLNKENIWKGFVKNVRTAIQTNPSVQENAQELMKAWIEEKKTSGPTLGVAA